MEKRLRASLNSSAEDFLSTARSLRLKSAKTSLKALIWSIDPPSDLASSLPSALHRFISSSIESFQKIPHSSTPVHARSLPSPPAKKFRRLSTRLRSRVESGTENENGECADQRGQECADQRGKECADQRGKECVLQDLLVFAHVANLCVLHPNKTFSPDALLNAVRELHDHLILFESYPILLSEIANLCEVWWKKEFPGRETLILQLLPFLIARSLTSRMKVDVHRLYMLREAFSLLDFEDESIEDLKLLLIRCVISPLYLKTKDGRRFLAFIFGLNGQLAKETLAMIRAQIPFGRKSMLEAYADIVFRAWKLAEGAVRDEIENVFLQGLIDGAIHAISGSFATSIRRVLGGFINQRTTDGVEKLLFRLAEPLIFRSLQVANSNVRLNALHLLLDMFPLEDPDATKDLKDTLLHKQFFLLERLLMDDCPNMRAVAVEGSCRILHLFWEVVSPSSITKTLTKIFNDMSHDSCSEVRLSTLNGVMYLLGNIQSHEILKVLLPRLGHLISDPLLSIRASVADLLLLLRDLRSFQFHKVVSLDALLSALANDQPAVAQKITRLLIPSYFPSTVAIEVACDRCITLIKRSPLAGANFCKFVLSEGAPLNSVMGLVCVLIQLSLSPDKLSSDQIEGVLVAAGCLGNNLAGEAVYKNALKELLSGEKAKLLFATAPSAQAKSSVLNIISGLHRKDGAGLLEECIVLVTTCGYLSDNLEKQALVRSARNLLLSCGGCNAMFKALTRVLQEASSACHDTFGEGTLNLNASSAKLKKTTKSDPRYSARSRQAKRRKSSKTSFCKFKENYAFSTGIAWLIKDTLIAESEAILGSKDLELAFFALKDIAEVSIVQCIHCDYMDLSPVLAYMALALNITLKKVSIDAVKFYRNKEHDVSTKSASQGTLLELTMDHLLDCSQNLIAACDIGKVGESISGVEQVNKNSNQKRRRHREPQTNDSDVGTVLTVHNKISNAVKILTAVLKFIVDASFLDLVSDKYEGCLGLISAYMQFFTASLGQLSNSELQSKEDFEEVIICLKSSLTYAAKLLNIILKSDNEASTFTPEAYQLTNHLLDLIILVEAHMGFRYTANFVALLKPWLPDLVLALGSGKMRNQPPGEDECLPSWFSTLAKSEVSELEEFPAFKSFMGMMIELARRNLEVLDAVGVIFLNILVAGLERKDIGLVSGLANFVCKKLAGQGEPEVWKELSLMQASLPSIYVKIEQVMEDLSCEDELQKLNDVKELLESIEMHQMDGGGEDPMMEEE